MDTEKKMMVARWEEWLGKYVKEIRYTVTNHKNVISSIGNIVNIITYRLNITIQ